MTPSPLSRIVLPRFARLAVLGTACLALGAGCGSDSPDAPPASTPTPSSSASVTSDATAGSTSAPVAGEDSANTLGSPGSYGEGAGTTGG